MGFLKVINEGEFEMSKILPYWSDVVFMEKSPRVCFDLSVLESGKKILVAPLQMLVQIREKKVIDVITEAGGYIYHSDLEKNKDVEQYAEVLDEYFEKDDAVSQLTEIVCINLYSDNNIINQLKEYNKLKEEKPETFNATSEDCKEECVTDDDLTQAVVQSGEWVCKCGTINKFNFCKECGLPKPMEEKPRMSIRFCRECGSKLPMPDIKFCPNCGTKL